MGRGMGKGLGKGGFFDMLGELGGLLQAAACCICLLCVLGPIFLIVGISFAVDATSNSRGELLAEVRSDAGLWTDGARAEFDDLQLFLQFGSAAPVAIPPLETGDEIDDIGSQAEDDEIVWTPLRYSASVVVPANGAPGDIYKLKAGAGGTSALDETQPFALCEQAFVTLADCRESCASSSRRRSSSNNNQQQCTSKCCTGAGGVYTLVGSNYQCIVTLQLSEVTMVAPSGAGVGGVTLDASLWTGKTTGFSKDVPASNEDLVAKKSHTSAGVSTQAIPTATREFQGYL